MGQCCPHHRNGCRQDSASSARARGPSGAGDRQGRGVPHHDIALFVQLDCTAVHWACRGGHLDAVKLLQDHGADLNVKDKVSKAEQVTGLFQGQGHTLEYQSSVGLAGVGADPP